MSEKGDVPKGLLDAASLQLNTSDFDHQLESLVTLINQVQDKYIDQWTGTELQKRIQEKTTHHNKNITKLSDTINNLQTDIVKLKDQKENSAKATSEQVAEANALKCRLEEVQQDTDRLLLEKEQAEKQLKSVEVELLKQQRELERSQSTEESYKDLDKTLQLFRNRLGLQLKKVSGERLQVVFTCIDPNDPSRPFCFCVKINPDRTYSVSDCEPTVPEFEELASKLNETNNFRSFVVAMRKRFSACVS